MGKNKKNKWIRMILTAVLLCMAGAAAALVGGCKKTDQVKKLHVDGVNLVDEEGNHVQLKGVSTHGLQWFPEYVNEDLIHEMATKWGVQVLRLANYTDEDGYCDGADQEAIKEVIDRGVQACVKEGIYVIIDWHVLKDGNPLWNADEAVKFFDEMSAKYADVPNVIYEICNEPNQGDMNDVNEYAEMVIPVIRANSPDAVVIIGTPGYSHTPIAGAWFPLEGYDNIMYTMHFYAGSDKKSVRDRMTQAIEEGVPVFITEFGAVSSNGKGDVDREEADAWMEVIDEYELSCCMWNISNKDESCAFFLADCEKTSGFTWDDLSDSAKWYIEKLTGRETLD